MSAEKETSWGPVASWYDSLLSQEGTYQKEVILPNLLRLMSIKSTDSIIDIACGQGFFTQEFKKAGAQKVVGTDIASELIAKAKAQSEIQFEVAPSHQLTFAKEQSFTKATIILSLQNILKFQETIGETSRVLAKGGVLYVVLNHPAFRIPGKSSWGWDETNQVQYRRIDGYLSEATSKIVMHPGKQRSETTVSFHRPLQLYFKALTKYGFAVTRLEEWDSHKKSERGPRQKAEDTARKEFPLFLTLEAHKL